MTSDAKSEACADWILTTLSIDVGQTTGQEDAEPSGLQDDDGYRKSLLAGLKQVRQAGEGKFGFALGKLAAQHRLVVHRARSPRSLAAGAMRENKLKLATWGTVTPHPEKPATLQLSVEGKQIPGLCKKGNGMLRNFRPLPFARMVLVVGGVEVDELEDPDDDEADVPVGDVPEAPAERTPQVEALTAAQESHSALCEECPAP